MNRQGLGRWFALLIALTLCLNGCDSPIQDKRNGDSEAEVTEEAATAAPLASPSEHLLSVWSDYLRVIDDMYTSELWALDYVDTYLKSKDWRDLRKARCACMVSARHLGGLSMAENDLDSEEYLQLAEQGVDTSFQSMEFSALANTLENDQRTIKTRFVGNLEGNIVFDSTNDILKQESSLKREMISYMMQYTCTMTNYLLVSLGDEAVAEEYWASMKEKYPVLANGASAWLDDKKSLEDATKACLDRYQKMAYKYSDLLSSANADYYLLEKIIKEKDIKSLIASANHMTNVPKLLPLPVWFTLSEVEYECCQIEEDGKIVSPQSGEEISMDQYGIMAGYEGVELKTVEEYISSIESYVDDVRKEPEENIWIITMPGYLVKIEWRGQKVSFYFDGEDMTLVPLWYMGLQ